MDEQLRPSIRHIAAGAAAGLAVAVAIGWWLAPVQRADSAPSALHPDYRDEYVLMIAAAYEVEQDTALAEERLLLLEPEALPAPLLELGERLVEAGYSEDDVIRLARLAWVLGETTPVLAPYLEDGP